MKIVLINPPSRTGHLSFMNKQYPLNLMMLAAYVRSRGMEPVIWDFAVEPFSQEELISRINSVQPELVGLTAATAAIKDAGRIAGYIKTFSPEITTVIGGVHASALPEATLEEFPSFDCLVYGEGEKTLFELAEEVRSKDRWPAIKGIVYRKNGGIVVNEPRELAQDLNEFPFPARDLINRDLYRGSMVRWRPSQTVETDHIITTRGCVGRCIYCGVNTVFKGKVRFRSADNVLAEIKECKEKYHARHIAIVDDTFTAADERFRALCAGIKRMELSWTCFARVNLVDEEKIRLMADSGCTGVEFGVESGSQRILDLMKKGITVEQIKKAFKLADTYGLATDAPIILGGHSSETKEDIRLTEKLLREIKPKTFICSILIPFPGTEINRLMRERGYVSGEKWEDYSLFGEVPPDYRTDHFTSIQLKKMQVRMIRSFYLRPSFIIGKLARVRSARELGYWFRVGIDFLKAYIVRGGAAG